ncbi:MAG TPA: DinB family protein [Pirellulales bacterium]|nr:DinB family protein [Pirellulales bacterium]
MTNEPLSPKQIAFSDLERELAVTRQVLERLPGEHYGWQPHAKSMTLGRLGLHVADLPGWMLATIGQDELDAANAPRPPAELSSRPQLLERFDANVAQLREAVAGFDVAKLGGPWTMRSGEQVIVTRPRLHVYRVWCLNHMVHHRAQLCLYLRLLDVPVPTVYFNTADDPAWVFE